MLSIGNAYVKDVFRRAVPVLGVASGTGVVLDGGRDSTLQGLPLASLDGSVRFASVGDAIWGNEGDTEQTGGLVARAALRTRGGPESSRNHVRVELLGTIFNVGPGTENMAEKKLGASGVRRDLIAYGAAGFNLDPGQIPGQDNLLELLVRRAEGNGTPLAFVIRDSAPAEPTNAADMIGS